MMIPYTIVRKRNCKHIKIRIKEGEVIVSSPLSVPASTIDRFVKENQSWILSQLQKEESSVLKDGDTIQILDEKYRFHIGSSPSLTNHVLTVRNQKDFEWMSMEIAKKVLEPIVRDILEKVGLAHIEIQYGLYTSKWGSFHKKKNLIKLNSYLIYTDYAFCVSVILHECAHYYEMNHSKRFYDIVYTWMPQYKEIQKVYKNYKFPRVS